MTIRSYAFGSTDFARSVAKDPFGYGVASATEKYTSAYDKDSEAVLQEQREALAALGLAEGETIGDNEDVMRHLAEFTKVTETM